MSDPAHVAEQLPIWSRVTAFPEAPGGYGWMDPKGRIHELGSMEGLIACLARDRRAELVLVWTPSSGRMMLPEALEGAEVAVREARRKRLEQDCFRGRVAMGLAALWMAWLVVMTWLGEWHLASHRSGFELWRELARQLGSSMSLGLGLLGFGVLGFIPWYQAKKRLAELQRAAGEVDASPGSLLRFETWLDLQKAPFTKVLAALIVLVGLAQWRSDDAIGAAGLVKEAYRHGEWWRLFTAPWLHGHWLHLLMNASALWYLGKRVEVFARWPHLLMVFVFSVMIGGLSSVRWMEGTSVGASGALMGWLGFLLVFESLHPRLVPLSARRRLLAGLLLTGLIGLLGYRFIDNAAHAGGLVAGMGYALAVFPRSSSCDGPRVMRRDRIAGGLAALILAASAAATLMRLAPGW